MKVEGSYLRCRCDQIRYPVILRSWMNYPLVRSLWRDEGHLCRFYSPEGWQLNVPRRLMWLSRCGLVAFWDGSICALKIICRKRRPKWCHMTLGQSNWEHVPRNSSSFFMKTTRHLSDAMKYATLYIALWIAKVFLSQGIPSPTSLFFILTNLSLTATGRDSVDWIK